MGPWSLLQIIFDIVVVIGFAVFWARLRRPPQDDPRLSRGLQLLQSKISVLEDLSDRTDAQVKQLTQLIEQKARFLQNKIIESEHQIQRVDQSMQRSKEVAEIFQDKIPHQEIMERQQTIKYVKAAQLAHAGRLPADIAQEMELPLEQAELIAKLNRDQLVFDPEALPEWAKSQTSDYTSLKKLGDEFRSACADFEKKQHETSPLLEKLDSLKEKALDSAFYSGAVNLSSKIGEQASNLIAPIENKTKSFFGVNE